jgi:hypothetical protein
MDREPSEPGCRISSDTRRPFVQDRATPENRFCPAHRFIPKSAGGHLQEWLFRSPQAGRTGQAIPAHAEADPGSAPHHCVRRSIRDDGSWKW